MINKKILGSLIVVGVVATFATGSTFALFNDTETSEDNTFTAGALDLSIGLSNGGNSTNDVWYNGEPVTFFDTARENEFPLDDVKPGDSIERTVAINVTDNPAYVCATLTNIENHDNGHTEPESLVDTTGDGDNEGDLAQASNLLIWAETDGDNVFENGETVVINRTGGIPTSETTWTIADAFENIYTGTGPLQPDTPYYMGVEYSLPLQAGNEVQTDSYSVDVEFYAEQSRNNDEFSCVPRDVQVDEE